MFAPHNQQHGLFLVAGCCCKKLRVGIQGLAVLQRMVGLQWCRRGSTAGTLTHTHGHHQDEDTGVEESITGAALLDPIFDSAVRDPPSAMLAS